MASSRAVIVEFNQAVWWLEKVISSVVGEYANVSTEHEDFLNVDFIGELRKIAGVASDTL